MPTITGTESAKQAAARRQIEVGKEAAIEAEVRAARERATIPLDLRMRQFRDMLTEKEVSAFSTWEKELHKIVFDARYLLLTSKERKQVWLFEKKLTSNLFLFPVPSHLYIFNTLQTVHYYGNI